MIFEREKFIKTKRKFLTKHKHKNGKLMDGLAYAIFCEIIKNCFKVSQLKMLEKSDQCKRKKLMKFQ